MKFWDGAQYRPISPEEAAYRIAEGQVPKVNADVPAGPDCPMCADELLHVHTDEKPAAVESETTKTEDLPAAAKSTGKRK